MFYLDTDNNRYYPGRAFTYGDLQYPAYSATPSTFTSLGFTAVTIGPRPNDRFYIVSGPDHTGSYTSTPRDLAELKTSLVKEQKRTGRQLLSRSDYLVLDYLEDNTNTIPADIATFRAAVRTAVTTRCAEINAVTTVAELETLLQSQATAFPIEPETELY